MINDHWLSGKPSLSLCWWRHSAVTSLIFLTDRQQPLPSPQTLIKLQTCQTLGTCLSIQRNLSVSVSVSLSLQNFTPWKQSLSRSLESLAMKLSLWTYHFAIANRSVVSLSSSASFLVSHHLPSPCSILNKCSVGHMRSTSNPYLVKLLKSRTTAHLHSFIPLPICGTTFHTHFNLILLSCSPRQLFTMISGLQVIHDLF